ncbi:MAG: T9SS type A sorting domain-containing protein [Candidatus Marinimicrobia bacterium]|nr:T9SS type A sorting domain-containing protein [Candidatus Neomarinimicrobiota bacterium]
MKKPFILFILNIIIILVALSINLLSQSLPNRFEYLNIPSRSPTANIGEVVANKITDLDLENRERKVIEEILSGNVPSFSRKLKPITINKIIDSKNYELTFYSTTDYMSMGNDTNYLYIPMTPLTAQYLADKLNCSLPTSKMVNIIYEQADIKLSPQTIHWSDTMTTVPVFMQHTNLIREKIANTNINRTADSIFAGHKKDVIISNKIYTKDNCVVIYGWHRNIGDPIQPVYNGHRDFYADYSHGIRLIYNIMLLNGDSTDIRTILNDSKLHILLSDEGKISKPYYPQSDFLKIDGNLKNKKIDIELLQNYPNPFNSDTIISYTLKNNCFVSLKIYDIYGKIIQTLVNQFQNKNFYSIHVNLEKFSNGIYLYSLKLGNNISKTKKMIYIK